MNKIWLFSVLAITLAVSCDFKKTEPGYIYFPDMTYSQAYESYSENPNFKNGITLQEPVAGTISREIIPFGYSKNDRALAGQELSNPLEATEKNISEGKFYYGRYCQQCHGEKGDGKGPLYTSKKYNFPVRSLLTETVQQVPDGEIYHVITRGYGVMGAHGSMITPTQRWQIVHYIKNVLRQNSEFTSTTE